MDTHKYFGHSSCWRNQSQITWNLLEQYQVAYRIGTAYGIFTWAETVFKINHYMLWHNSFLFRFIFKHSDHSVNKLWREWSCSCLHLPSPLYPQETLFTWIILFNARHPLMSKVIFMFRPLLDQPIWHKRNEFFSPNVISSLSNTYFKLPYLGNCSFPIASFKIRILTIGSKNCTWNYTCFNSLDKLVQHMLKLSWKANQLSMVSLSPRLQ